MQKSSPKLKNFTEEIDIVPKQVLPGRWEEVAD